MQVWKRSTSRWSGWRIGRTGEQAAAGRAWRRGQFLGRSGQNQPVSPGQLGSALGPGVIKTLSQITGVSEADLSKQLSQVLPGVVNSLTPNGRLPTVAELSKMMEQQ